MQKNSATFLLLLALAAFAPLPFGSSPGWAAALLAGGTLLALCLWTVETAMGRVHLGISLRYFFTLLLCYAAVIVYAGVQMALSGVWFEPATALPRLLCYGAAFWISAQFSRSEIHARWLLNIIAVFATLYALYGLAMHLGGMPYVLWQEKTQYQNALTSTFLSRNNCAVYLGMGAVVTLALLTRRLLHDTRGHHGASFFRQVLENMNLGSFCYGVIALVQIAALAYTASRSGILAFTIGIAIFGLMLCMLRPFREQRYMLLGLVSAGAGITLMLLALTLKDTNTRWDSLQNALYERGLIAKGGIATIKQNPWKGYGLGNFEAAYAPHTPPELQQLIIDRHDRMNYAHNSYLQLPIELGLPAAALLMLCPLLLAMRCMRGVLKRRLDGAYPALGVALTVLMAVQATLDYGMEIPAIAFTYSLVMGACWAQSFSSWEDTA